MPVHAVPCCTIQISLPRLITYGELIVYHRPKCTTHVGQSSGTWHALFMQQKAADKCEAVFTVIAVQLLASLPYRQKSDPKTEYSHLLPPLMFGGEKIFLITIIISNVGDATVITTEL